MEMQSKATTESGSLVAAGMHLLVVVPTFAGALVFTLLATLANFDPFALAFLLPGGFAFAGCALAFAAYRRYSVQQQPWLAFHAAQAAALSALWFVHLILWLVSAVLALILIGLLLMIPLAAFTLAATALSLYAAVRIYRGGDYHYLWLATFLARRYGVQSPTS